MDENNLKDNNCILLPLASCGLGVLTEKRLRDDLYIPKNRSVAIILGSISDWSMAKEVIDSLVEWPDNWVLIVHNRYGNTADILARLNIKQSMLIDKLFISNKSLDMVDDMGYILNGISAGIALYKPDYKSIYTGDNLKYLGLSSGKISTCLRYGVPVIMNELGIYSEMAKKYGFGYVVEEPYQIKSVLHKFENDDWSENAKSFFEEYLDFKNYSNSFWEKIDMALR